MQTTNQDQARLYIQKIYDLVQSGEEFPVDLGEVWMIQYTQKGHAVTELKNYWREDVDYQTSFGTAKKVPYRQPIKYKLTITCFVHLIVFKIGWLREVYNRIVNGLLSGQIKPSPDSVSRKQLAQMVLEAEEEKEQK